MNALVALVISCRMKHSVIDKPVVISVNSLSHKEEIIFKAVRKASEPMHEIRVKTVRNVKSYSINFKIFYPVFYTVKKIIYNFIIFKVELYKVIIALPAFIPESVIPCIITIKINIKPITIW